METGHATVAGNAGE